MSEIVHELLKRSESDSRIAYGDFLVEENAVTQFPSGTKIKSASRYGSSNWTTTARLNIELPDGSHELVFLKCACGDRGRIMMEGEFSAMTELHKTMPNFVPKPHSWGRYRAENIDAYFFLQEFIDMSDQLPDPDQLCSKLSILHRTSVSPTGKFGFHITSCQGHVPQAVTPWETCWTDLFARLFQHVADLDTKTNGHWEALSILEKKILSHVIPKLIGNLEREGRSIKPCLIHGDLWEGNTGTSCETGDVYIFDSGAFYAHNEMEMGNWRCHYNKIHDDIYTRTYLRYYERSEPCEEWDDRNRMYCIYYNIIYSVNHQNQGKAVRQT
jgi:protein-ribulosamine 3-kinase